MDYSKLQNGSDVRGIALPGIQGQDVNLTEAAAEAIGRGFLLWLKNKGFQPPIRIGIGRDSRISGPDLLNTIARSMAEEGAQVYDLGLASTPAMFMSTVTEGFAYDASVMVTASHLPFNRNGFKFFLKTGGLEGSDIKNILALAGTDDHTGFPGGSIQTASFMPTYSALLKNKIQQDTGMDKPLTGLKILVDAGNGAGGFFVDGVLKPLGADTTGSQFLDPDGSFPNHIPNPENADAMASVQAAVLKHHADLGIIFDTDVDRAGAVLPDGSELNRNKLIAILAAILLRENPGSAIVTDSVTSTGLAAFIQEKGGVHHRFKRGYRNVINESIRLNQAGVDSCLAMETSGHGALKENYFLDDGAYLMVKLLSEMARGRKNSYQLEDLICTLKEPLEAKEFRIPILAEDFRSYGQSVLNALEDFVRTRPDWHRPAEDYEGIRIENENGWFLLRLSLHEPILPLNLEGDVAGTVETFRKALLPFLKQFEALDLTASGIDKD